MSILNRNVLDAADALEVALELLSFSGGENTISEDHVARAAEARVIKNWNILSLGGMQRMPGINKIGDGGGSYATLSDLLSHHKDGGGTVLYGIINGDLVKLNGTTIQQEDAAAFTAGILSHGVSVLNDALWITNATDNLKRKTVGGAIATPASVPTNPCARIYNAKTRLLAEGAANTPNRVYGCRAGIGNWTAANAWSLANDAFSIDLPEDTRGMAVGFPSGNENLVFTESDSFVIYNFPNVAFRPFAHFGSAAPYAIAVGDEGVYFVSRRPTLAVFLMRMTGQVEELTQYNRDVFVEDINFSNRIFGIYRNRRYYLIYNESNSGVSYPNRVRIFDARFGAWIERPINLALGDNMGIPALLKYSNAHELYMASSRDDKWYEFEIGDDDEGVDTQASYKTKDFTSRDFAISSGGSFAIDNVRLKLIDAVITFSGSNGQLFLNWEADRGLHSGTKVLDMTQTGGFILGVSMLGTGTLGGSPVDRVKVLKFPNNAVGTSFNFNLVNNGQGVRPKVKKVKIRAIALEEV